MILRRWKWFRRSRQLALIHGAIGLSESGKLASSSGFGGPCAGASCKKGCIMKALVLVLLGFAAVIGTVLFIRYRYYKSWNKFLDDAAEQVAFDFLPGPIKIVLALVLVIWGGSALVSYLTAELRHKDPSAQPLAKAAPLSELAKAADLSGGAPQPPPGGMDSAAASEAAAKAMSDLSASAGAPMPDLSALTQQAPQMDPQQMEELAKMAKEAEKKLEEMRKQQMATLPKPVPEHLLKRDKKSAKKTGDEKKEAEAKKPGQRELAKIELPKRANNGQVLLSRAKAAGPIVLTETAPDPLAMLPAAPVAKATLSTPAPVPVDLRDYSIVVKTGGKWFEARLLQKASKKWTFERPNGDIVSLPPNKVKQIMKRPLSGPMVLN